MTRSSTATFSNVNRHRYEEMLKESAIDKHSKLEDFHGSNDKNIQCVRFNEKETEVNIKALYRIHLY